MHSWFCQTIEVQDWVFMLCTLAKIIKYIYDIMSSLHNSFNDRVFFILLYERHIVVEELCNYMKIYPCCYNSSRIVGSALVGCNSFYAMLSLFI